MLYIDTEEEVPPDDDPWFGRSGQSIFSVMGRGQWSKEIDLELLGVCSLGYNAVEHPAFIRFASVISKGLYNCPKRKKATKLVQRAYERMINDLKNCAQ